MEPSWMIAKRAFLELGIEEPREITLNYSGHFKGYNGNVRYSAHKIAFTISKQWSDVDEDIQVGLLQNLIVKMRKLKTKKTSNMELYESYLKGLSTYAKKHIYDPELEASFDRVNAKFFDGSMQKPNLVYAQESFTKLGSYEYGTDTIYMSTIFKDLPLEEQHYLDYVMYHELLHKKHTFNLKNGRHSAHTRAFRIDEAKFGTRMEEKLGSFLRRKKFAIRKNSRTSLKSLFKFW
ncbi:MAG: hypothetical protein WC916_03480 [Candidatus Woesearchaeota archaeon]